MKLRDDVTREMLADMMMVILESVKFYKADASKLVESDPQNEFQACMRMAYQTIEDLMDARLSTLEKNPESNVESIRYKRLA